MGSLISEVKTMRRLVQLVFPLQFLQLLIIYITLSDEFSLTERTRGAKLSNYHNYKELVAEMEAVQADHPDIALKYSIGNSVRGRELLVMRLSQGVRKERELLRPMVKFVANMHGDEVVGRELMIALIRYLADNYGVDSRVTRLLDRVDIHIMPTMNPDGFEKKTRENANGVDLNRGFPTWDDRHKSRDDRARGREPEVRAVMDWILDNPFVLSINFHDGAVVANYPWDDKPGSPSEFFTTRDGKTTTPDQVVFEGLAQLYSDKHKTMHKGSGLCRWDNFPGGITNGADWYIVRGGLQDFNYMYTNCMEITVELSCKKWPDKSRLQIEWDNNKESLLAYMEVAMGGVRGVVKEEGGKVVEDATVRVKGINNYVETSSRGEYWRLLGPGKYSMRAVSESSELESESTEVLVGGLDDPHISVVNFTLDKKLDINRISAQKVPVVEVEEEISESGAFKLNFIPGVCLSLSWSGMTWC